MAAVALKSIKKIYPLNSEAIKKNKDIQPEKKKVDLQITDEGVVAVQEFILEIKGKELIVLVGSSVHPHATAGGKDVVIVVSTMDMTGAEVAALRSGTAVKFTCGGNNCHVFSKETLTNLEVAQ